MGWRGCTRAPFFAVAAAVPAGATIFGELTRAYLCVRACGGDCAGLSTRMRRAIRLGSVEVALLAAGELNHVGLDDALELCLLLCGDRRYALPLGGGSSGLLTGTGTRRWGTSPDGIGVSRRPPRAARTARPKGVV